jgi:2-keto-4-pentenoate hydratase
LPSAPRPVLVAPIFAPTIVRASPCPVLATGATVRIEPEIAFVMARDLPPRASPYTQSEIRDAIGETRLVLEILGSRYSDADSATFPEMLADGLANQGLFVGPVLRIRGTKSSNRHE